MRYIQMIIFVLTEDPTKNNLPIQHFTGFQDMTFCHIAKNKQVVNFK